MATATAKPVVSCWEPERGETDAPPMQPAPWTELLEQAGPLASNWKRSSLPGGENRHKQRKTQLRTKSRYPHDVSLAWVVRHAVAPSD